MNTRGEGKLIDSLTEFIFYGQNLDFFLLFTSLDDINTLNSDKTSLLHVASYHQNLAIVSSLLSAGADVHALNSNGETPLLYSCRQSNTNANVLELLYLAGANIDSPAYCNSTALHYSIEYNNHSAFDWLFYKGANPHLRRKQASAGSLSHILELSYTALHLAIKSKNKYAFDILLPQCSDVDMPDSRGDTPLHIAALSSLSPDVFAVPLLQRGASSSCQNRDSFTPLDLALKGKYSSFVDTIMLSFPPH